MSGFAWNLEKRYMRKIEKILGTFLMVLSVLFILTILLVIIPILKQDFSVFSIAAILLYLAVSLGLFYLGFLMRLRSRYHRKQYSLPKQDTRHTQPSTAEKSAPVEPSPVENHAPDTEDNPIQSQFEPGMQDAWNRISGRIAPLSDAFHFESEYVSGKNRLSFVFRDRNLPAYRIYILKSHYYLYARAPFFKQEWSRLASFRALKTAVSAMIWHAAMCGAGSNISGELRYNGEGAFLDLGKLDGPLYTEEFNGQYQVTVHREGDLFRVGFYTDRLFTLTDTKDNEDCARISASVLAVKMEYFLSTCSTLETCSFIRPECKSELCRAFMSGRIPEERLLWPPLHLSSVRTVEDMSNPGMFGQENTRKVEIMQDEEDCFFLMVQEHSVTSGSNGRPETLNTTVCYLLSDPEKVNEKNWKTFVSAKERIILSTESFCGV